MYLHSMILTVFNRVINSCVWLRVRRYWTCILMIALCTCRNQRLERKLDMMTHKYQQVKAHAAQASSKPLSPNTSALSMQHHLTSGNKVCITWAV